MSDLWLVLALVGTFGAILLTGFALDGVMNERKRAVRLLESQVSGASDVNLREQEMSQSFSRRALIPVLSAAGRVARRVTPLDARDRLTRKLLLAGSPAGWDAERVMAFKIIGLVGGFVLGFVVASSTGLSGVVTVLVAGLFTFAGFIAPDSIVNGRVEDRQREILRTLSDTLDLLTISVEAGLSLNASISQVVQNVPGVLSQEFARMLQEIQLGVPRSDAFRHLAERTDVDELNAFALAMIQADVFGVSIAGVLRTQAEQLRIKRRQRAEAKAQQIPVKIVFPLILCVLPALFVVIVGPGAIRIATSLLKA
ncbi:MAG: type II secretion system F family protein [Actinomycetota bacterium]|jgi:tight adherence protein C|nr:type II secretion system F family protein [Actinomycetota bacterium]